MKPEIVNRMRAQFAACLKASGAAKGFRAEKKKTTGELYIYDVIGQDFWTGEGVTAKTVAATLEEFKDATELSIFINSPGGLISEGKAIYTQLQRFAGTKTVYVDGIAASAASFIAMAGDRIVTGSAATWMIHEAMGGAYGFAEDLEAVAEVLRMLTNDIAAVYEKRTGQSRAKLLEWMAAETWMDAETAKERGFTDEIADVGKGEPEEAAAVVDLPMFKAIESTRDRLVAYADVRRSHLLNRWSTRPAASRETVPGQPGRTAAK